MPSTQDTSHPPELSEIFIKDFKGDDCVTQEGIDWIWPMDDREPLDISEGHKGFILPPTCEEQIPCHEIHGQEACLRFAFGGDQPNLHITPLPSGIVGIITVIAAFAALKRMIK